MYVVLLYMNYKLMCWSIWHRFIDPGLNHEENSQKSLPPPDASWFMCTAFRRRCPDTVLICGAIVCSELQAITILFFYDFVCYLQLLCMLFKNLLDFSNFVSKKQRNLILFGSCSYTCASISCICACCPVRDCKSKIWEHALPFYCIVLWFFSCLWIETYGVHSVT